MNIDEKFIIFVLIHSHKKYTMNTLSKQLTELYESKWKGLMGQIEANGLRNQLQCPFLISLLRSGQKKEEREKARKADADWYLKKENPKNPLKKDSTTDFFLNFITRQKSEQKKDESKQTTKLKNVDDNLKVTDKAYRAVYHILNSLNAFLDRMLQSNLSIKVLSFMLAIILLLTINGSITNIFTAPNGGDYLYDVPIKVEGLQSDYDVVGLPETVNVALVGPSLDIYTTKISGNYEVIADFSTLGEGEHTIELKSEGFPNDLQVMIVPQTVTVRITQKVTKTFELGYDFINEDKMDEKYSVSVESMEHNAVEVQGSQDDIDRINSVMATIDLDGVNKNFEQDARIHAYDRSGEEVDVEIIPKTVKVNCSVSSYSKEVPITPTYTGQFASGYGLENITLSKDRVRIYGKEELLNSINEVHVEIDISNVSSNKTYERLQITGTENINKMDFDTIDAQIQVGSTTTTTISDIPINVINNENNYKVNFASGQDKASVIVEGTSNMLAGLTSSDFNVTIDLENLKSGRNTVKVNLSLNKGYLTGRLTSPERITITLERQ